MAKIYCGEVGTQVVYDCMRVMGVNSYDRRTHPLDKYMRDMLCFPIYDAGNMGMQRRKIWGMIAHKNFNPRAWMDNDAIEFTKEMEGIGAVATPPAG
jgi:alkylation response protein AidB-like acyl-CoA dehydrogenase